MSVLPLDATEARPRPLKLGFLGVGWIGRNRMEAMLATGSVRAAVLADPTPEMLSAAREAAPGALCCAGLDELLAHDLDGVVIATPSAQHAEQTIRCLESGLAVFCQKPLGRSEAEVRAVVDAACKADRLLGVDFSYRHTEAVQAMRRGVRSGELGRIYAADLTFHNAYGPDKPWFYDPALSGGGCMMDLGVHLIDLAAWVSGEAVSRASGSLFAGGRPLVGRSGAEDYGVAELVLDSGALVRLACSWRLPAGQDAVISAAFYGTDGAIEMRNVDGSFYDFVVDRLHGTRRERLVSPPDAWGGRAAAAWAGQLAQNRRYDPAVEGVVEVARVLDDIYRTGTRSASPR